ncbi:MAG TPA: MFS transporter [Patescibacteria group bacterium]|nr:MFS transporter [Patescibacteria group bacterium]
MNNRIVKTLAIRPFLFLILAEIFSQLAINMLNFVLIIVTFTLTKSSTAVSGVILSFTIPSLLLGLLAGAYVDKWNKKKVLYAANFFRAILVFLLVFAHSSLALIYVLCFAISVVSQFFIPAETPMIPIVVRKDLLLSANAIFGIIIYASIFIAYAISGPLLLVFGQTGIFIFLSASFLLAALFASLINIETKTSRKMMDLTRLNINFFEEIKQVFAFFQKVKVVYNALFLLALAQIIVLVLAVIGPGYAEQVLKIKVEQFPLFFVTPAVIGTATGAVLLSNYLHKHSKQHLTRIGLFLLGLAILVLPYGSKVESRAFVQTINSYLPHALTINILHMLVVLAFFMGLANAFIFVPANTILQEETSDEFRGKVYGFLNTIVGFFSLLPIILVGGLADLIGTKAVITGIGGFVLLIAIISYLFNKRRLKII